jgi:hypothetical protein
MLAVLVCRVRVQGWQMMGMVVVMVYPLVRVHGRFHAAEQHDPHQRFQKHAAHGNM